MRPGNYRMQDHPADGEEGAEGVKAGGGILATDTHRRNVRVSVRKRLLNTVQEPAQRYYHKLPVCQTPEYCAEVEIIDIRLQVLPDRASVAPLCLVLTCLSPQWFGPR